jgi:hypothetical protein
VGRWGGEVAGAESEEAGEEERRGGGWAAW